LKKRGKSKAERLEMHFCGNCPSEQVISAVA
jgi:hypothetical protein